MWKNNYPAPMFNRIFGGVIVVTIFLLGCKNDKTPGVNARKDGTIRRADSTRNQPDTIRGRDIETYPSLQPGITLDTTTIDASKHHTGIRMVMPVITTSEHPWLSKELHKFKTKAVQDFIEETKGDSVYKENGFLTGWGMWAEPLSLYKTDDLVSFILKAGSGHTGMPAGYWFPCFNYDNRLHKPIRFSDYFVLDTPADSTAWAAIVSKASGRSLSVTKHMLQYNGEIAFGLDEDNVYLCFEKGHIYNYGVIPIRKGFFITSIRSAYR